MSKSAKEGFEKTDEKRLQAKSTIAGTRQIIPLPAFSGQEAWHEGAVSGV
jgi:hypothetical protein